MGGVYHVPLPVLTPNALGAVGAAAAATATRWVHMRDPRRKKDTCDCEGEKTSLPEGMIIEG